LCRINEEMAAEENSTYKRCEILSECTIDKYDLLFVDILIKDTKTVVEVDGAFHFIGGDSNRVVGKDLLNTELYELLGYKVIRMKA
jgi:very-short-patch-repair endonuclease